MEQKRRGFLRQCAWAAGALAAGSALRAPGMARGKPLNIVLVLVDDLGWAELGCYGNRFNETPNLDRLAVGGVRFTDAYASAPVCSPTRAALLTGQYPARVGITDYLRADDEKFLSPEYETVAERLRAAGYGCGLIGKWHLMGDYGKRRGDPKLHGFDEVICSETSYIGAGTYFHPYKFMPEVEARAEDEYLTDRLNQEAVDFMTRNRSRPFFLLLSHYAVHTRLAGKQELVKKYGAKPGAGTNRNNPELAAMLESVDQGVGMILAAVEKLGVAGRTAVMFTSDNGGEDRVTSNAPLRAGKSTLYEGGIRVPLIVSAPGFGKRGSECRVPVSTADFYPTFLEMAGLQRQAGEVLDGASLQGAVRGDRNLDKHHICWHYPLEKPHFLGGRSSGAIREGDYKLIEFYDDGKTELHNLREDLGEARDLAGTEPARAARLRGLLEEWRKSAVRR